MEAQNIISGFCPKSTVPSIRIGRSTLFFKLPPPPSSSFYRFVQSQSQKWVSHGACRSITYKVYSRNRTGYRSNAEQVGIVGSAGGEIRNVRRKKLAIFVSGGGSNFRSIHEASLRGSVHGDVVVLVTNKSDGERKNGGEFGRWEIGEGDPIYFPSITLLIDSLNLFLPLTIKNIKKSVEVQSMPEIMAFRLSCILQQRMILMGCPQVTCDLVNILRGFEIDFVLLAGYLKLIPVELIRAYERSIINIHPSLLPTFGGKGHYGMKVHKAVIASGARYSGPTIHIVDEHYDTGRILAQRVVPVLANDSANELAARVLKEEHQLYVEVVEALCEERTIWREDGVPLIRNKENPNELS